jgi:hypothetical protein
LHLKLHSNRSDTGAVEILLVNDTGDETDGTPSDSVLDFAVQQVRPRMERTREAFDRTCSSAAVCRGVIADLLLMGAHPAGVLLAPRGPRHGKRFSD